MTANRRPATREDHHAIEQFLLREARLLDERRYSEWLQLLAPEIRYVMLSVENRYARDAESPRQRMAFFDDTIEDLERRVARFEYATAWPEDPPTRHFHVISNIETYETDTGFQVFSVFVNYRCRGDHDEMLLVGRRADLLRRVNAQYMIASREIFSGQSVLSACNLNTFL